MVGSFFNVCSHRMPRDISVVTSPSHCPNCDHRITWRYNLLPLISWLFLRGKCAYCRCLISVRYVAVEALVGLLFLTCWLIFGPVSVGLAVVYGFVLSAFVVAPFSFPDSKWICRLAIMRGESNGFLKTVSIIQHGDAL
ncbi:MAG: Leader peptidase PppA [Verrucomicrobia subdivision 3 bacterium]|nr:Leader peptidase PppA [Limisphaerales bacterium]MCS1412485.1 Leader peptidase PppA [Limisphaerales bacterium]